MGTEAGVSNRRRDQDGIEAPTFLCTQSRLPPLEVDLGMTDAIQAPQGLLGPVRSQRSRHAIDTQMSLFDLGNGGAGSDAPKQSRGGNGVSKFLSIFHVLSLLDEPTQPQDYTCLQPGLSGTKPLIDRDWNRRFEHQVPAKKVLDTGGQKELIAAGTRNSGPLSMGLGH